MRGTVPICDIEKTLGLKVESLPADYEALQDALKSGTTIAASSKLGKSYRELAKSLIASSTVQRNRPADYFSLVPARSA